MKSNICIKVEFLAGTSIGDAITEAKEKAIAWDVTYVTFDFNGVAFSVSRRADVELLTKKYLDFDKDVKHIVG